MAADSAGAAGTARPKEQRARHTTDATGAAVTGDAARATTGTPRATDTAGAACTPQPTATATGAPNSARHADRTGATRATDTAATDEAGGTASAAVESCRPGPTIAAVAPQETAGPAGLPCSRRSVNTITDQWTTEQRLSWCIDNPQDLLLHGLQRPRVGRLSQPVGTRTRSQHPDEVVMEQGHPRARHLILPTERTE
ncbi:hypothetical protein [Mycobacterium sp. Z3061]|uniref:hypothetical protein n=1 Tax=Mycobacterium sp. Z3061 TaxID=3073562 RepID=UPI0028772D20|nr:hypothetical protein [Mycobacterium sp. Z3061]